MSACRKYRGLIEASVDGIGSPEEERRLQAHLLECPACARELNELTRTRALIARLPELRPPSQLKATIATRLRAQRIGWFERIMWSLYPDDLRTPATVVLLLLICLSVGLLALHGTGPQSHPSANIAASVAVYSTSGGAPSVPSDEYMRFCELTHRSLVQERAHWEPDATLLTSYGP
ncbi:MAG: anti-sigma factor family protein [Candidatus Zipacnadales bacterium]